MRVLILSMNVGEGHNSCGKAVMEELRSRGIPCEMEDAFRFISPAVSRLVTFFFVAVYRHLPGLFHFCYRYAEEHSAVFSRRSPAYRFLTAGNKRLHRFILEGGYDTVVCPHVLTALMVTALMEQTGLRLRTSFIATDYTCSPSCAQSCMDAYFIPDELLAEEYVACGVPREKLIISGIPLRQTFNASVSGGEAKAALGLPADCRHLLVMCGSMGCGPIGAMVDTIARTMPENCFLSIVCGTNQKLRQTLERSHRNNPRIRPLGYVDYVPLLMDSADLYLTKPGGISVTEAAHKALPMVFVNAVAGCETHNLNFFIAHGAARTADTPEALAAECVHLLNDAQALERMSASLMPFSLRNSAEIICDAIQHPSIP